MISGGLLIDALTSLKVGDLEKVKLDDNTNINSGTEKIYKLIVYRNAKEEYRTFVSIECTQAIDAYLSFRRNRGEIIQDSSPLIRKEFREADANIDISPPKTGSLENVLQQVLYESGVRVKGSGRDASRRLHSMMRYHSCRKYFASMLAEAGLKDHIHQLLIGHIECLTQTYVRVSQKELLSIVKHSTS